MHLGSSTLARGRSGADAGQVTRWWRDLVVVLVVVGVTATGCGSGGSGRADRRTQLTTAPATPTPSTAIPATTVPTTVAPTTTTVPPPAGVAGGNPWPTRAPIAAGHHAVLVMGDSIAGQTYWSLPTILGFQEIDATVYDATMPTAGLLDPMYGLDPVVYLASQLDAHPDVDTVVFEFAGACAAACTTGGVQYNSDDFFARWQAVAHQLMTDAKARVPHVIWAISPPPPMPDDPSDEHFVRATQVAVRLIQYDRTYPQTDGVVAADWYAALADVADQWQHALWYDGAVHVVRSEDLVHLTPDGSVRTSTWTIAALAEAWAK